MQKSRKKGVKAGNNKSKDIKLKPVKISLGKKEDKKNEGDLEGTLENEEEIFKFNNFVEFLRPRASGSNTPVLPVENIIPSGVRFGRVISGGEDKPSGVSYDLNAKEDYAAIGKNAENVIDAGNNQAYTTADTGSLKSRAISRQDMFDANPIDIVGDNRLRGRINPIEETRMKDDYSPREYVYKGPSMDEMHERKLPGQRRRDNL